MKFDHIGVVTQTLEQGRSVLENCFPISGWTMEFADPTNGVYVQFGRDTSGICYELVAPLGDDSPVAGALRARHNILNHVAYLIDDLSAGSAQMRRAGAVPVAPARPAVAYGGQRVQFFVSPLKMIIELVEAPEHRHQFLTQS